MAWADAYIKKLQNGETVQFRPRGNSMRPKIENGALVTVKPYKPYDRVYVGDVVLCKVNGQQYLHYIKQISNTKGRFLIGNARGHVNGWTTTIYGVVAEISS